VSAPDRRDRERSRNRTDQAESGAPAVGRANRDRFSANEIFQRIVASAEEEFETRNRELVFSGVAAGFAITLTVLAYAAVGASVGGEGALLAPLLYPLGFVFIVVGHYQLYTENTLPPVTLVLTRLASVTSLLRVWSLVIVGNLVGVTVGAYVLANTGVLLPEAATVATTFGQHAIDLPWWTLFYKAVFAGWLVAGLVWLDHASRDTAARILIVYVIMFTVPSADLFHVITSMCDALYLYFTGGAGLLTVAWEMVVPVLLGNTVGGVVPVAVLNFAQTEEHLAPADDAAGGRLSASEWLLGGVVGRSHVAFEDE
jgi:formate/nitrite transporter FocA (FNT family)